MLAKRSVRTTFQLKMSSSSNVMRFTLQRSANRIMRTFTLIRNAGCSSSSASNVVFDDVSHPCDAHVR
ncbi:hypothetical protein RI054_07g37360 [Pseudoscourfieldia marina]